MTAQPQCLDWPQYIKVHFITHTQIQSPDAWLCLFSREEKTWAVMKILIGKEMECNAEVKKRCGDHWCCCLGIISLAATPRKRQKTANENTTSLHKIWFKQMEKIVVLWYHLLFLNFIFKQFSKKWESILNTSSARKSSNISPKKRGQLIQTVSKQFANDRLFRF